MPVKVNQDKLEKNYERVESEKDLGGGACSDVFLVRRHGSNEQPLIAKKVNWESGFEVAALQLCTHHPDIVTLHEVCDRRKLEDSDDKTCHFIFDLVKGGYLEEVIKKICKDNGKGEEGQEDEEPKISRPLFLQWACQMAQTVAYIHDEHHIMHTDLHARNWLVREDGNLVLADFGCAKILGKDGKRGPGEGIDYYEGHSPPEMQSEEGKTKDEFSFNGDTWQLGFCFQIILNGGRWHRETPKNTDSDIKELISWMHTEDKHTRPQMRPVADKLKEMLAENKKRDA